MEALLFHFNNIAIAEKIKRMTSQEDPQPCPIPGCKKGFTFKKSLLYHILNTHLDASNHRCRKCDKGFFNSSSLKVHEKKCDEGERPPVEEQRSIFKNEVLDLLDRHSRAEIGEKEAVAELKKIRKAMPAHYKLVCPRCEHPREDVYEHIMVVHIRVVNYRCGECNKGFFKRAVGRKHEMTCKKQEEKE